MDIRPNQHFVDFDKIVSDWSKAGHQETELFVSVRPVRGGKATDGSLVQEYKVVRFNPYEEDTPEDFVDRYNSMFAQPPGDTEPTVKDLPQQEIYAQLSKTAAAYFAAGKLAEGRAILEALADILPE